MEEVSIHKKYEQYKNVQKKDIFNILLQAFGEKMKLAYKENRKLVWCNWCILKTKKMK